MTKGSLEKMARAFKRHHYSLGSEHDPRIPPHGRVTSAKVVKRADGEFMLQGILELWDLEDADRAFDVDDLTISVTIGPPNMAEVSADRSFQNEASSTLTDELADLIAPGSKPHYHVKKSVDSLSTLTVWLGIAALEEITEGFLLKLGGDIYGAVKNHFLKIVRTKPSPDLILIFSQGVEVDERIVLVEVLVANPTTIDVERVFGVGFPSLGRALQRFLAIHPNAVRLVLEWKHNNFDLLYAVRADGVPSIIQPMSDDEIMKKGLSVTGTVRHNGLKFPEARD